uniref:Uncharacterized protein n=1 Tax=Cucumis melo TaxID=3656 RepID=A0A9I9EA45_CUCME
MVMISSNVPPPSAWWNLCPKTHAVRSVVSTNDVILNRSRRDIGVGASHVRAAQHHWPNKPPISRVDSNISIVRGVQLRVFSGMTL